MNARAALEALKARYDTPEALALDPLSIPLAYADPLDREVAAWVAAHLAYGRVAPMLRAIRAALQPLGPRPAAWLRDRPAREAEGMLSQGLPGWVWRFHTASDLVHWILAWKRLDAESGHGLEPHVCPRAGESPDEALSRLVQRLRRELPATRGLRFSLPDPREGAACKRWRMFLRWMVRRDWPDLGSWRSYPPGGLVIPLDTHVARVAGLAGFTQRRTPDGRMASEITETLRGADPADPLRYDFALSHLGILGDCTAAAGCCGSCPLAVLCHPFATARDETHSLKASRRAPG